MHETQMGREQRWQAALWRAIAAEQEGTESSAARITAATDALAGGAELSAEVPARLLGFGVSTLPPLHLELLAEVARQRDVHLWIPSPSPALWQLGWDRAGDDEGGQTVLEIDPSSMELFLD